jgi:hypothetical protein
MELVEKKVESLIPNCANYTEQNCYQCGENIDQENVVIKCEKCSLIVCDICYSMYDDTFSFWINHISKKSRPTDKIAPMEKFTSVADDMLKSLGDQNENDDFSHPLINVWTGENYEEIKKRRQTNLKSFATAATGQNPVFSEILGGVMNMMKENIDTVPESKQDTLKLLFSMAEKLTPKECNDKSKMVTFKKYSCVCCDKIVTEENISELALRDSSTNEILCMMCYVDKESEVIDPEDWGNYFPGENDRILYNDIENVFIVVSYKHSPKEISNLNLEEFVNKTDQIKCLNCDVNVTKENVAVTNLHKPTIPIYCICDNCYSKFDNDKHWNDVFIKFLGKNTTTHSYVTQQTYQL